jgi:hypothetical protein
MNLKEDKFYRLDLKRTIVNKTAIFFLLFVRIEMNLLVGFTAKTLKEEIIVLVIL